MAMSRHTASELVSFDAREATGHREMIDAVFDAGDVDVVVVAFGLLGDQEAIEAGDDEQAIALAETNYVGAVSVGLAAARRLRQQGHGALVVLSSVAGERARRSNFVYGSTKAGLRLAFYQGLADSLVGSGASVLVVRPGFVHSRMTAGHGARAAGDHARGRGRAGRHRGSGPTASTRCGRRRPSGGSCAVLRLVPRPPVSPLAKTI